MLGQVSIIIENSFGHDTAYFSQQNYSIQCPVLSEIVCRNIVCKKIPNSYNITRTKMNTSNNLATEKTSEMLMNEHELVVIVFVNLTPRRRQLFSM